MLLLNEGQRPLLEFLRNLTPQALLATTGLVLGRNLDLGRIDLSNWMQASSVVLCFAVALLAFFANMNQYLDALLNSLSGFSRVPRRLRRLNVSHRRIALATLKVMLKRRPSLFFDFVASIALVNLAWVVIALAALASARAALR